MVLGDLGDDGVGCHVPRSRCRRPAGRRDVVALVNIKCLTAKLVFSVWSMIFLCVGYYAFLFCGQGYMCHMFFLLSLHVRSSFSGDGIHAGIYTDN
jgi:hypothetical protein